MGRRFAQAAVRHLSPISGPLTACTPTRSIVSTPAFVNSFRMARRTAWFVAALQTRKMKSSCCRPATVNSSRNQSRSPLLSDSVASSRWATATGAESGSLNSCFSVPTATVHSWSARSRPSESVTFKRSLAGVSMPRSRTMPSIGSRGERTGFFRTTLSIETDDSVSNR